MALSSDVGREGRRTKNWWPRKKKKRTMYPRVDGSWIKEWIGDERIFREKPKAWSSKPQIGMDKIRATTNVGKYFVDFASSSTVHGLNHLSAPHRHPVERVLAVLFVAGALVSLILLSMNFWDRYQNNAVISTLDTDYRSFTITKPAIVVCPADAYDEKKFEEVFKRHGIEDTKEAREFFAFLANSSYPEFHNTPIYNVVPPEKWLSILWELRSNVTTDYSDQTSRSWIVTERGLCMYFYTYVGIYSSYEYWMENNWTREQLPEEIPSFNYDQREEIISLSSYSHSVKLSTVHPMEIPNFDKSGIFIGLQHHILVEAAVSETKTSEAVKGLSVHQRKCKRPEEGGLEMWPIYSRVMCSQECGYRYMRQVCGCHPHFARPMAGIPVCNAEQLRCIGNYSQHSITMIYSMAGTICGCVSNCDTASYIDTQKGETVLKEGSPNDAVVNIQVNFPFEIVRRELLFGFIDFLTSVGGAAGLFLGASVISFVEIIYYATLRLFWYRVEIRKTKKNKMRMKRIVEQRKKNNIIVKF